jgi:alpha-tubulin suppressor-like RCC1 family protein/ABC-type transport system involved in multi-copper enzyme maturation permease subunit
MKTLVAKETRLLWPAYAAALLLALLPVWLLPSDQQHNPQALAGYPFTIRSIYPFSFGAMLLALSSFGREFGLGTFGLLLAQPLERNRIWWTKVAVLTFALATILVGWDLSCTLRQQLVSETSHWAESLALGATALFVMLASGLWTTLFFRQTSYAFWFSILVPALIAVVLDALRAPVWLTCSVLTCYALAGFLWAWRRFLTEQDTTWTGGIVSFPGRRDAENASMPGRRVQRPLPALFWKEVQLQQFNLIGMACLFVVHLGVVALRKAGSNVLGDSLKQGLEVFAGIWLLVPVLLGSTAVAEERKLGVLDEQLCLPVSSRIQFWLKLLFVLLLGGFLSPFLLWVAEGFGNSLGPAAKWGGPNFFNVFWIAFVGLSLLGFYASTLARNLVQAMAIAVVASLAMGMFAELASYPFSLFGHRLWRGSLVHLIAWPTFLVAILWLALWNFRHAAESWRHNLVGIATALVISVGLTAGIYNRAWELFMNLEPPHGTARFTGPKAPVLLATPWNEIVTILLPDGRVWEDQNRILYSRILRPGTNQLGEAKDSFIFGSNWVSVADGPYNQIVAVRSDGTLWASQTLGKFTLSNFAVVPPQAGTNRLVQVGNDTNWSSVVRGGQGLLLMLLKNDGTLWRWGTNIYGTREGAIPLIHQSPPHRLGSETNWAAISKTLSSVYAWKKDGSAWAFHAHLDTAHQHEAEIDTGMVLEHLASLDQLKWRSLGTSWPFEIGVRDDGTLWTWRLVNPESPQHRNNLMQIGRQTDWAAIASAGAQLTLLKTDGSLWSWYPAMEWSRLMSQSSIMLTSAGTIPSLANFNSSIRAWLANARPARMSKWNNWVAVGSMFGGTVSLAADGGLWFWWDREGYCPEPEWLLRPSRRPIFLENIFDYALYPLHLLFVGPSD